MTGVRFVYPPPNFMLLSARGRSQTVRRLPVAQVLVDSTSTGHPTFMPSDGELLLDDFVTHYLDIRDLRDDDAAKLRTIHETNGLPENCFPNLTDPLLLAKSVVVHEDNPVMASFVKGSCEIFLIIDHEAGTPEQRWQWLQALTAHTKQKAWELGLDQLTCWIPPEIEKSFAKRLTELGFVKSPWTSWSMNL